MQSGIIKSSVLIQVQHEFKLESYGQPIHYKTGVILTCRSMTETFLTEHVLITIKTVGCILLC